MLQTFLVVYVFELGVICLEKHDAVFTVLREGPLPFLFGHKEILDLLLVFPPFLGIAFLGPRDLHLSMKILIFPI